MKIKIKRIQIITPAGEWPEQKQHELHRDLLDLVNRYNQATKDMDEENASALFHQFRGMVHGLQFADVVIEWEWLESKAIN